ncbi:MAG TPA: hypothetical protein VNO82_24940 [Solirubrobacteraceae bacterium]|nr:hypothetical protein [Solirubrobacteraceae bacterium]
MRAADDTRLDTWLPEPVVRTHHRRTSTAAPAELWRAANAVRLRDTRTLGRLVRWRIPDLEASLTYGELFRSYPFTVVDEGEHHLLAGLCGRIWTLARDYPRLEGPDEFAAWDEPGTVRVLFGHWVEDSPEGSALVSEARVEPVDRTASLRLRTLWKVIGPFEKLVGAEAIERATERSRRA